MSANLFTPLQIRKVSFRNRIVVSPMCQYSSENGFAEDWHLVHYGSRAIGGAGAVIMEASAVSPEGRISPNDLGIYLDEHVEPLRRITRFVENHGAVAGIQIAHAGRKASCQRPWDGDGTADETHGGWRPVVAPSPIPFNTGYPVPEELDANDIQRIISSFGQAAKRAKEAGFKLVEIHAAHGYLLHEFLSPLSNKRTDEYGGSFENRTRIVREVISSVRNNWDDEYPLFIRLSVTDWMDGGWDLEQSKELARMAKSLGVDLIDCSSGALVPNAVIPAGTGFQTVFAHEIRYDCCMKTGAVGFITSAEQADHIIRTEQADVVLLARQMLRDPYWPQKAARKLRQTIPTPVQYSRAW